MTTPTIETNRLILRPLKVSDAETAFRNWTSDPNVAKFTTWSVSESLDETIAWLTNVEANASGDKHCDWGFVLKETDELIGSGGFVYNEEREMFEIGYVIMQKYWNMGLTTEAARAMVDFAVKTLGVSSICGKHAKENAVSGKILEKLGFVYQNDGEYSTFDGVRTFECREYIFDVKPVN